MPGIRVVRTLLRNEIPLRIRVSGRISGIYPGLTVTQWLDESTDTTTRWFDSRRFELPTHLHHGTRNALACDRLLFVSNQHDLNLRSSLYLTRRIEVDVTW